MSLNPHPIVLTTASERRRAELLALAEPAQQRCALTGCARIRLRWRREAGARTAAGILTLLFGRERTGQGRRVSPQGRPAGDLRHEPGIA